MTSMHAPPHLQQQQQQQQQQHTGHMGMPHAIPTGPPPVNTTRILELSRFPVDMKTKDIQAIFAPFEDDRGGFKIKWVDDTKALIVFQDPINAKRALLHLLSNPPEAMSNPACLSASTTTTSTDSNDSTPSPAPAQAADLPPVLLRPYTGPDVPLILASVLNRPRSRSNASTHHHSNSQSHAHSHSRKNSNVDGPGSSHTRTGSFGNSISLGRSSGSKFVPGHGLGAGSSGSGSWARGGAGGQGQGQGDVPPVPPLPSVFAEDGSPSTSPSEERGAPGLGEPAKRLIVGGLGGRFAAGPTLNEETAGAGGANGGEGELERKVGEMKIGEGPKTEEGA